MRVRDTRRHEVVDPRDDVLGLREADVALQLLTERFAAAGRSPVVGLEDREALVDERLSAGTHRSVWCHSGPPWMEAIVGNGPDPRATSGSR